MVKRSTATAEDLERAVKKLIKSKYNIMGEDSEVSHYSEDSGGQIRRRMVRKSTPKAEDLERAVRKEMERRLNKHRYYI